MPHPEGEVMTKEDPERGDGMSDPWVLLKGPPPPNRENGLVRVQAFKKGFLGCAQCWVLGSSHLGCTVPANTGELD